MEAFLGLFASLCINMPFSTSQWVVLTQALGWAPQMRTMTKGIAPEKTASCSCTRGCKKGCFAACANSRHQTNFSHILPRMEHGLHGGGGMGTSFQSGRKRSGWLSKGLQVETKGSNGYRRVGMAQRTAPHLPTHGEHHHGKGSCELGCSATWVCSTRPQVKRLPLGVCSPTPPTPH